MHSFWKTTHSEARYKAVDASCRLASSFKEEKWKYGKDKNENLEKFFQYEHSLNPPITFLCDKEGRNTKYDKNDDHADPKRVLFMYHFKTKNIEGTVKKYTFLKLEGFFSLDPRHIKEAVKRYVLGKDGQTGYKLSRREDCYKNNSCMLNKNGRFDKYGQTEYHITKLCQTQGIKKQVTDSVEFYSKHIRTGDELFVPQDLTDMLLEEFNQNTSRLIQRDQRTVG